MAKLGIIAGAVVVFLYLSAAAALFFGQRKMLYHPTTETYEADAEPLHFEGPGGKLNGWVVNSDKEVALIYFAGNAENVEHNLPDFKQHLSDYAVYVFQYRGYGESEGKPTEKAFYEDALFIFDEVESRHDAVNIFGRSLGTGIATYVTSRRAVNKLLLVTAYDSIVEVARPMFTWFPIDLLVRDRFESWKRIDQFATPTLIMSAGEDQVIRPERTRQLIAQFPEDQLDVIVYPSADHNNIATMPTFYADIRTFLSDENQSGL